MEFQTIIAEVDFNHEDDREAFGVGNRVASLNRFTNDEGQDRIGITFALGRKQDDTINVIVPSSEFIEKLFSLEREP